MIRALDEWRRRVGDGSGVTGSGGASDAGKPDLAALGHFVLIQELLVQTLRERRLARRWSIFFRALAFCYLTVLAIGLLAPDLLLSDGEPSGEKYVSLIRLEGEISSGGEVDATTVVVDLRDAFEDEKSVGIILLANSPGGSPAQSAMIHDHVMRLREEHPDKKVLAVITDVCASGCYYAVSAAEEIYAAPSSIVGSIGVRMDGFGFTGAMERLGIERRLMTAGEHKALVDPFSPEDPVAKARLVEMLRDVHRQFIDAVVASRGDRVDRGDGELFTGLVWSGAEAVRKGLVDGLGDHLDVARRVFGSVEILEYSHERPLLERLVDYVGATLEGRIREGLKMR